MVRQGQASPPRDRQVTYFATHGPGLEDMEVEARGRECRVACNQLHSKMGNMGVSRNWGLLLKHLVSVGFSLRASVFEHILQCVPRCFSI